MPVTGAKVSFGVALDGRDVARREALEHVEVAGAQIGEAHGRVGDRREDDAVEIVAPWRSSAP